MRFSISRATAIVAAFIVLGCSLSAHADPFKPKHAQVQLSDSELNAKMDEVDALIKSADQSVEKKDNKGAIASLNKALDICQTYMGEGPYMVMVLQFLELDYARSGDNKNAEMAGKRALMISDAIYDKPNDRWIISIENMGGFYLNVGRYREAEPNLNRALTMSETVHGHDAPENAFIMGSLVELYQKTGRKAEARAMQKRLDAMAKTSGQSSSSKAK